MNRTPTEPTRPSLVDRIAALVPLVEQFNARASEISPEGKKALDEALSGLERIFDSQLAAKSRGPAVNKPEISPEGKKALDEALSGLERIFDTQLAAKPQVPAGNKEVTVNRDQQVYVIPSGDGYSCRGFASLFEELGRLAKRLGLPAPKREAQGTMEQYAEYRAAIEEAQRRGGIQETWFHSETPLAVRDVLEAAREKRTLVRVYLGNTVTGESWMEEFDTVGRIGRSCGILKIPLLIPVNDDGGPALLDHCIVRVQNARTGRDLYRHPGYHTPEMQVRDVDASVAPESQYPVVVDVAGQETARFKSRTGAERWIEFMNGDRMST